MTQLEILKAAYNKVLEDWDTAYDCKARYPDSQFWGDFYENCTKQMEELRALMEAEEQKLLPQGRLTKWNGKKWVLPQGRTSDGESYFRIIAERLAEYENTGLTPDEIVTLKKEAEK